MPALRPVIATIMLSAAPACERQASVAAPTVPAVPGDQPDLEPQRVAEAPAHEPKRKQTPLALRWIEAPSVACGTDGLARHPTSLADFDGDGVVERVGIVRDGRDVTVNLHPAGALAATREIRLPGDYVEVAVARWGGSVRGDLWLSVGVASDPSGGSWSYTVYRLDNDKLARIADDVRRFDARLDIDGDGRADPILDGAAFYSTRTDKIVTTSTSLWTLHGMALGHGLQAPVDLDGDGDLDVLMADDKALHILEVPSFRRVWSKRGKHVGVAAAQWQGATVILGALDFRVNAWSADAKHTQIVRRHEGGPPVVLEDGRMAVPSLANVVASGSAGTILGPSGKVSDVSFAVGGVEPAPPSKPRELHVDASAVPNVVGVRVVEHGTVGGLGGSPASYEVVVANALAPDTQRVIFRRETEGQVGAHATLVDFDGDGIHEVLIRQTTQSMDHHGYETRTSSTLIVLNGDGDVLWEDATRVRTSAGPHWFRADVSAANRPKVVDNTADVRVMALRDNGGHVLHVRAPGQQGYVVAASDHFPEPMPSCLE